MMPSTLRPRARTEGLLVERLSDEVMIYDLDRDEVHCLSPMAAWLWQRCDGATTVDQLAREAAEALDLPEDRGMIRLGLSELEAASLLAGPAERTGATMTRRDAARRLGLAGAGLALALPFVTTLAAPTPLQASSEEEIEVPPAGVCTSSTQCGPTAPCCHRQLGRCTPGGPCLP